MTAIQAEEFKQGVFLVFSSDSRADSACEPMHRPICLTTFKLVTRTYTR